MQCDFPLYTLQMNKTCFRGTFLPNLPTTIYRNIVSAYRTTWVLPNGHVWLYDPRGRQASGLGWRHTIMGTGKRKQGRRQAGYCLPTYYCSL